MLVMSINLFISITEHGIYNGILNEVQICNTFFSLWIEILLNLIILYIHIETTYLISLDPLVEYDSCTRV